MGVIVPFANRRTPGKARGVRTPVRPAGEIVILQVVQHVRPEPPAPSMPLAPPPAGGLGLAPVPTGGGL